MSQTKAQLLDGKSASVQFNSGSAAAPTVTFTGNTTTGLYSPGANQLSITTNGIQALAVDASQNVVITGTATAAGLIPSSSTIPTNGVYLPATNEVGISTNSTERLRVDASGRLLVGASSAYNVPRGNGGIAAPGLQRTGTFWADSTISSVFFGTDAGGGGALSLARSNTATVGNQALAANNDVAGTIFFSASDGTTQVRTAQILSSVDGTPGTNDMPGRLVFSTTADGAGSPTERFRITNDGVWCYNQITPVSYAAAATLVIGDLKNGIIQYTGGAATLTLPTGTLTEGGFSGIFTNLTFEWSVINTGSGICTIGAGASHTITGSATITVGASGRFATRRTAANTFVSYRIS